MDLLSRCISYLLIAIVHLVFLNTTLGSSLSFTIPPHIAPPVLNETYLITATPSDANETFKEYVIFAGNFSQEIWLHDLEPLAWYSIAIFMNGQLLFKHPYETEREPVEPSSTTLPEDITAAVPDSGDDPSNMGSLGWGSIVGIVFVAVLVLICAWLVRQNRGTIRDLWRGSARGTPARNEGPLTVADVMARREAQRLRNLARGVVQVQTIAELKSALGVESDAVDSEESKHQPAHGDAPLTVADIMARREAQRLRNLERGVVQVQTFAELRAVLGIDSDAADSDDEDQSKEQTVNFSSSEGFERSHSWTYQRYAEVPKVEHIEMVQVHRSAEPDDPNDETITPCGYYTL